MDDSLKGDICYSKDKNPSTPHYSHMLSYRGVTRLIKKPFGGMVFLFVLINKNKNLGEVLILNKKAADSISSLFAHSHLLQGDTTRCWGLHLY